MILKALKKLDQWITRENVSREKDGTLHIQPCHIRVLGQVALIEAHLDLELAATMDVDVYADYAYGVEVKFGEILKQFGVRLDPTSGEIWMPNETEYDLIFEGRYVKAYIARPDYVLVSKALKAPFKNKGLLIQYLQKGPSQLFITLAEKYQIRLEEFVKE